MKLGNEAPDYGSEGRFELPMRFETTFSIAFHTSYSWFGVTYEGLKLLQLPGNTDFEFRFGVTYEGLKRQNVLAGR